jgi:WD40 repeat protein
VADAVAFAHAGGVIHRDLKPENVMLGDYGEVLVMDWGLARITPEFAHVDAVYQADSLGGTPAYMSPEMAKGPVEAINKTSDVYLLGAILYEIIGGQPPHSGRDVMQCLMSASQNRIDPIRYDGELKEIALKAMASQQEDRYQTVKEFQEAVRVYQSHSESLVLTAHANQNLQKARTSGDYALYARALYGFQESLTLWDANHRARTLLTETQRDYATSALQKGDLDLAASLVESDPTAHAELIAQIGKARAERSARQRRLRLAKFVVAALIAGIIVTVSTGLVLVQFQRNKAVVARNEAEKQRGIAEDQRKIADEKRQEADDQRAKAEANEKEAVTQKGIAEEKRQEADVQRTKAEANEKEAVTQKGIAEERRQEAEAAKKAEEYEAYVAQIGLAAAKINDNAYGFAANLLQESQQDLRNWEWGRLDYLSRLGAAKYDAAGPVDAVAYSPDGKLIATGDMVGDVTIRDAATGKILASAKHGQYVFSVAFSPDGRYLATGSSDGKIRLLDVSPAGMQNQAPLMKTLPGHGDGVLSVRFSPDSRWLASGSYDNSARVWDVAIASQLQELKGHSWWVWSAEFSPDGSRLVTASQDGSAVVWERKAPSPLYSQRTKFSGHNGAVYSARFSPDGKLVATGGYDKLVMIWNPDDVKPVDIKARLNNEPDPKPNYARLSGHDGPVRSVSFSPNGQLVLSGSEDNTLRIWDVAAGESLKTLRGHGQPVRACVFSPDKKMALSGGDDNSVRVWNVAGYQEVRVLSSTVFVGHEDAVLSARFSRDGKHIVTASRDRTASLWDTGSGNPLKRFQEGHDFLVSGVAFFPGHLATGAGDNSVRTWNLTAGTQEVVLPATGRIGTLAASPDGSWVFTGSPGTDVKVWNTKTGALVETLGGHAAEITSLAFSPQGDRVASGDDEGGLRLWRQPNGPAGSGKGWVVERQLAGHNGSITGIRFTPDGRRLVTASGDRTCNQWDVATGQELAQGKLQHDEWISSLDVSTDGTLAITTCDDGVARLWRLSDGTKLAEVKSPGKSFNAVGFSPDGSTAALTSAEEKRVWMWNLSAATAANARGNAAAGLLTEYLNFNKLGGEVWAAMYAPGGRHLLTIGGNDATLWNLDDRSPVVRYSPHGAVASAALSPDGKLVATGSWDHSAKIWDRDTGRALRKLEHGHKGYINSVEFSPDGRELLTASDDYTARLWDVASGKPTPIIFQGHTARVVSATFSRDGKRVLTVSGDKTAIIWDRATGKPLLPALTGHQWAVLSGRFSSDPEGSLVITGSQDATAIIWETRTGKPLRALKGHTAPVTSVAFSPDGTRALTGSRDNTAKLWDAATGKEILSLPGHTQEVTSVSFSPDGLNVLTSSRDGTAIIWLASDWRSPPPQRTARAAAGY